MTLDEFLLARIREDEEVAAEWERDEVSIALVADWDSETRDPQPWVRLRAECHAKRLIVEYRYSWNQQAERAPEPPFGPILQAQVITADAVLRALASVYADHPDYEDAVASSDTPDH